MGIVVRYGARKTARTVVAKGELAQKEMEQIASVAKSAPREKQRVVFEEMLKETKKAHELVEIAREEAEEFAKGRPERVQLRGVGPDENRLRRIADLYKDVRGYFNVANLEMIKNESFRMKAAEYLEKTREHCDRVLNQLGNRKWYQ